LGRGRARFLGTMVATLDAFVARNRCKRLRLDTDGLPENFLSARTFFPSCRRCAATRASFPTSGRRADIPVRSPGAASAWPSLGYLWADWCPLVGGARSERPSTSLSRLHAGRDFIVGPDPPPFPVFPPFSCGPALRFAPHRRPKPCSADPWPYRLGRLARIVHYIRLMPCEHRPEFLLRGTSVGARPGVTLEGDVGSRISYSLRTNHPIAVYTPPILGSRVSSETSRAFLPPPPRNDTPAFLYALCTQRRRRVILRTSGKRRSKKFTLKGTKKPCPLTMS
jgi:hypothetical protein